MRSRERAFTAMIDVAAAGGLEARPALAAGILLANAERRRSVLRRLRSLGILCISVVATTLIAGVVSTFAGIPVFSSARASGGPGPGGGGDGGGDGGLAPLSTVPVPEPANFADFIRDRGAAIVLGKALFWDMQAGSDGKTACATCHFSAGADLRSRNQLNPRVGPFVVNGPNFQLSAADFPAAMTGNTVQLGIAFVREQWPHLAVVGTTLGAFFCGALFSSFIRRRLPHPALELLIWYPWFWQRRLSACTCQIR